MIDPASAPIRLKLDGAALADNWRALSAHSGDADCAAAVKADGYGLGARQVVQRLSDAGCRQFFVAHWQEAAEICDLIAPEQIAVLNGFGPQDAQARAMGAIPVLNTPQQIADWQNAGGGKCHVMLDSGINRLGIGPEQLDEVDLAALDIDILMSHLASADEDSPQNEQQRAIFAEMSGAISCNRRSFANSAGIMLGADYHYDLTRPGLSLYGGIARAQMDGFIRPVLQIEAQVLQLRRLRKGSAVGYNATHICDEDMPVATVAIGYADGYLRGFSSSGAAHFDGQILPVIGRVSMDLVTLDARAAPSLGEGDWVNIEYDLPAASRQSGLSQYELLTGLGARFHRIWK